MFEHIAVVLTGLVITAYPLPLWIYCVRHLETWQDTGLWLACAPLVGVSTWLCFVCVVILRETYEDWKAEG